MARNKQADEAYNAQRRYRRAAIRHLNRSEELSGAAAARERQLAKTNYESALAISSGKDISKRSAEIQRLAAEFGYDPETSTKTLRREDYINQSKFSLESSLTDENVRREQEARTLLNDDTIGSRILGGLVDVWRDTATVTDENGMSKIDNRKIVPALLDYFKVDSLADMIDKIEESIGSSLYDLKGDLSDIYEYVRITLAEKVRDNTLVA